MNIYGSVICLCGAPSCKSARWFVQLVRKDDRLYWKEVTLWELDTSYGDIPFLGGIDLSKWISSIYIPYEELPLEGIQ